MKKNFLFLFAFGALCCSGGNLRIDISGLAEYTQIKSSLPGTAQSSKPQGKLLQKTSILPTANDWKEFSLEFTPPRNGVIHITLRGTDEDPVLVDGFSKINATFFPFKLFPVIPCFFFAFKSAAKSTKYKISSAV